VRQVDFFEVLEKRRSVRAFTSEPVTAGELGAILKAVGSAPSAGNLQAYEVVAVRDRAKVAELAGATAGQTFIAGAQVCLVFLANPARSAVDYGQRGRSLYCVQDATIAACHAHLACAALGLSSVWVGAFADDAVRRAVAAPRDLVPVCVLPIGRPAETPKPTTRRALSDLVHEEKLGAPWPGR
jgi:nitroreductase